MAAPSLPVLIGGAAANGAEASLANSDRVASRIAPVASGLRSDFVADDGLSANAVVPAARTVAAESRRTDETDAFFSTLGRLEGDVLLDLFE